jgi:arylsulfatase A-like enzyme
MEPHDPYTPTSEMRPQPPPLLQPAIESGDVAGVSRRLRNGVGAPLAPDELAWVLMLYGLEIHDWDADLPALLDGLGALGVRDSTVVVVLGDHGEEFQEHGFLKHGVHLYDELLHVPVVIAGPGITAGRLAGQVQGVDLFPTIAALLGIPAPPGLPGQNLLAGHEPRPAFSSTRYGMPTPGRVTELLSVRAGGWKLIEAPSFGRTELYDLSTDPGEHQNVADRAPERERLAALIDAWRAALPAPPPVAGGDSRLHEKLRALGYVD